MLHLQQKNRTDTSNKYNTNLTGLMTFDLMTFDLMTFNWSFDSDQYERPTSDRINHASDKYMNDNDNNADYRNHSTNHIGRAIRDKTHLSRF